MDEISSLARQLKDVEYFKALKFSDLVTIVSAGQVKSFNHNQILFTEGAPCAGMYVLLKGRVTLYKTGPEGQVIILDCIQPVTMFNEVAILDGGANPLSAVTAEESTVWFVNRERFHVLLTRYPQVSIGLLKVLARRNRLMIDHYDDLSFRSVNARIAKHLLDLSENGTKLINRLENPIKTMAAHVVTTPEAVSRSLQVISSQGIIEVDRKSIRVINLPGLQQLAQITC